MSDPQPAPARIVANRYALFDEIGVGGMASVHIGRLRGAAGFMRTVAIKRLHPALIHDPEFVSMLIDEARLAARIRHPNVVQTLDVVLESRELFVVMEYIHGESVSHLMRLARELDQPIPFGIAVTIIADTLRGLHAAHETKDEHGGSLELVHRDVSPQNILVGTDGLSRVLDFGIAKSTGSLHISQIGRVKGKFSYIAPEQIADVDIGRQADIYSASVVLWELLTGRRLFHGDSQEATLAQVLAGEVPVPSSLVAGLPRELDAVVSRGLVRIPANRFATAAAMATALEQCCELESHTNVAVWVEQLAKERLQLRTDCVARMEQSYNSSEVSELRDLLGKITNDAPDSIVPPAAPHSGIDARREQESKYGLTMAMPSVERRAKRRRNVTITAAVAIGVLGAVIWMLIASHVARPTARAEVAEKALPVPLVQSTTTNEAPAAVSTAAAAVPTASTKPAGATDPSAILAAAPQTAPVSEPHLTPSKKARKTSSASKSGKQPSPFSDLGGRQ